VFRTTIRATDAAVTEIPAIKLPAFDPETGVYREFASDPIPLRVRAVREVTIADAIGTIDPNRTDSTNENTVTATEPGVWARADLEPMLVRDGFDAHQRIRNPAWIGTMASGPTLALVALLAVRRRERLDPAARALRRGWAQAKQLDRQGLHAQAIRTLLGARTGCDAEAFSAADLESINLDESMNDEVRAVLCGDEQAGFAQMPAEDVQPAAGDLLPRLHRAITRAHQRGSA